jgi:ethanolamine transporter EutH
VRKGLGSVIFVLGIVSLIAGLILTIVSANDKEGEGRQYPDSFHVAGPCLLALAALGLLIGVLLYNEHVYEVS